MRPVTRRSLSVFLVMLALVLPVELMLAGDVIDDRADAARIAAWVDANVGRLPTTLEAISAYPNKYRPSILAALPPETRSRLWHDHLVQFAAARSLSPEQRSAVEEAITLTAPSTFEPDALKRNSELEAKLKLLCDRLGMVFDLKDRQALNLVGSPATRTFQYGTLEALRLRLVGALRSTFAVHARFASCECNQGSWCDECQVPQYPGDPNDYYCSDSTPSCVGTGNNCGCFGYWACNNICVYTLVLN